MRPEEIQSMINLLIKSYRWTLQSEWTDFLDTKEEWDELEKLVFRYLLNNYQ